ncbi:MAG: DUF799 domain-containing protein [Rhizobacter sp.]
MNRTRLLLLTAALALLSGCATQAPPYDYTAFMRAKPASLLVLPPVNDSPDVTATSGVWAHATRPLAEAGYYVLPITLVDETFRQNGVTSANEVQDIPLHKLHEFFGADAAVYLRVKQYGTSYAVVASETRVTVEGHIVDLRSGETLWKGAATASSSEQQQQSQGGLAGLLIAALVKQIVSTASDASYKYAGMADYRLLNASRYNGVPPGPRSPNYGQPPGAAPR